MYVFQNLRSSKSRVLNFQFLSGSSMRVEKALSLFFLREMEKEFDDASAVAIEMPLQIDDGTVTLAPDASCRRCGASGNAFVAQNLADARGRSAPPRSRSG